MTGVYVAGFIFLPHMFFDMFATFTPGVGGNLHSGTIYGITHIFIGNVQNSEPGIEIINHFFDILVNKAILL